MTAEPQHAFIACHQVIISVNQQGTPSAQFAVFFIVHIDTDDTSIVKTGDVLKDSMSYDDALHAVSLEQQLERIGRQRLVFLSLAHQSAIPHRPLIAVKKSRQGRMFLALCFRHEKGFTHCVVHLRQCQVAVIEGTPQSRMHIQVRAYYLHRVARGQPAPQFGIWTEETRIVHIQPPGQFFILVFSVAQVAGQYQHLVVAQQKRETSAGSSCFLLQLVEKPENLRHVLPAVKHIAYHHQVVLPESPT